MKQTRRLINGLVACAAVFALVSIAAAQTEGTAKVIRIKGPARFTTGNNVWQPLKVGTVLKPGSIIQTSTEEGSYVDVALGAVNAPVPRPAAFQPSIPSSMAVGYTPSAEQNVVRIWQNSALGIDRLSSQQTGAQEVTDTQLDLKQGHITGNVKKMSAASKYEIKLPNGVAGIRGTLYDITSDGVVQVYVGSLVLSWVDPKSGQVTTQVVMGGQQYDARTGQLTPLPESAMRSLQTVSMALRYVSPAAPTYYAPDKTVQFLSPVGPLSRSAPGQIDNSVGSEYSGTTPPRHR